MEAVKTKSKQKAKARSRTKNAETSALIEPVSQRPSLEVTDTVLKSYGINNVPDGTYLTKYDPSGKTIVILSKRMGKSLNQKSCTDAGAGFSTAHVAENFAPDAMLSKPLNKPGETNPIPSAQSCQSVEQEHSSKNAESLSIMDTNKNLLEKPIGSYYKTRRYKTLMKTAPLNETIEPEAISKKDVWQKLLTKFRASKETKLRSGKPDKCRTRSFHSSSPPKQSVHSSTRITSRSDGSLSSIPYEDPVHGKEYAAEHLWELYFGMNEFLDTVYGSAGLRRYHTKLHPDSNVIEKITEASKPIRRFRFYLLNLLGFNYNPEQIQENQQRFKVSGLESLKSMVKRTQSTVRASIAELFLYDVPDTVRNKLVQGLEDIRALLDKSRQNRVDVFGQHRKYPGGFILPTYYPPLPFEQDQNKAASCSQNCIVQNNLSQYLVQAIPEFQPLSQDSLKLMADLTCNNNDQVADAEEEIMLVSQNLIKDGGKFHQGESKHEALFGNESLQSAEYVKLPYSWEELMKLIDASSDASSQMKVSCPSNNSAPKCNKFYLDDENVQGKLILSKSKKRNSAIEASAIGVGLAAPHGVSASDLSPLSFPVDPERLRRRLQRDRVLKTFPLVSSSSSEEFDFTFGDVTPPSTKLQNVSAELKGWARRKSRQLGEAKTRFTKLFKKN